MGKHNGLETKQSYLQPKQQEQMSLFCEIWRNIFHMRMILFLDSFGY